MVPMHWPPINDAGELQLVQPVGSAVLQVAQLASHPNSSKIIR